MNVCVTFVFLRTGVLETGHASLGKWERGVAGMWSRAARFGRDLRSGAVVPYRSLADAVNSIFQGSLCWGGMVEQGWERLSLWLDMRL